MAAFDGQHRSERSVADVAISHDQESALPGNGLPATSGFTGLQLGDDVLASLANDIETEEDAQTLGRALAFKQSELNRFMATNRMSGSVTCKGTREMLFAWRQRVPSSDQPKVLREALVQANLIQLAEEYSGKKKIQPKDLHLRHLLPLFSFEDFSQTLRNHYNSVLCPIQRKPWDPTDFTELTNLYTDITLSTYHQGTGEQQKIPLKGSVNAIFGTKVNGDFPKRILLTAPGGHGKTCAVAKLAHDWANRVAGSSMNGIVAVFVLKMREISKTMGLGEAIISQLLGIIPGVPPEAIEHFIEAHQSDCALICDGYDEYKGSIKMNKKLNSLIHVLRNKQLKNCRVLVTTRPHLEGDFLQGELARTYSKMEIEGFTPEYATEYINRYFLARSVPHKATLLLDHLNMNYLLKSLIKVPLFCTMICHLFEEGALSDIHSMSTLFNNINQFLLQHGIAKENGLLPDDTQLEHVLFGLGKVAFSGLIADGKKLIFKESDFSDNMAAYANGIKLGIISASTIPLKHLENNKSSKTTVEFFHKLEQEYCASMYVQQLGSDDQRLVPRLRKSFTGLRDIGTVAKTLEFENVLCFVAGASPRACRAVFKHIARLAAEFVMYYKCRLVLHCLLEAQPAFVDREVAQALKKCFADGKLDLYPLTDSMMSGMERLPQVVKSKITSVSISSTHPSAGMTKRLWSCLALFDHLHTIYLNNISLSITEPLQSLPSVRKLQAWSLHADTFRQVTNCLTAVEEMEVWIGYDRDLDDTVIEIARSLDATGETLRCLEVIGLLNKNSSPVSRASCIELGRKMRRSAVRLERLSLEELTMKEEEGMIDITQSCQSISTMKEIKFKRCGSISDGSLHTFVADVGRRGGSFQPFRHGRRMRVTIKHNDSSVFHLKIPISMS